MLIKAVICSSIFLTFSSKLFCQTTDPSSHPLLDKYYPQPKRPEIDTSTRAVNNPIVTQQTGIKNSNNLVNKPASKFTPIINPDDTTAAPTTTTTHSITGSPSVTTTSSSTTVTTKPAVILNNAPGQPPKSYDPNSLYDTRLGSSAPQYDTYEKNRNGEGSVTTSPK